MLVNVFDGNEQTHDTMCDMLNSEFIFHMTGSRYFGGASPSSDYDMFVEYNGEVVAYLEKLGFVTQLCRGDITMYGDMSVACIMGLYLPCYIKSQVDPLIHVQLIYPDMMYVKKTVNEFFKDHPSYLNVYDTCHRLSKEQARNVWTTFMVLVHKVYIETKEKSC